MSAKYKTNHERMLELIEQLTKADIAYYRDDNPIMLSLIHISEPTRH